MMRNALLLAGFALLLSGCGTSQKAEELKKELPKTVEVAGKTLALNGIGIRVGSRMGFTAKVYKAGLYTEKKYSDSSLVNNKEHKQIFMRVVHNLTARQMKDGFYNAYKESCLEKCEETQGLLVEFGESIPKMPIGSTMTITFHPDKVDVEIDSQPKSSKTYKSAAFSKNLLAVFVGPKVLDTDLRNGFLGKKQGNI